MKIQITIGNGTLYIGKAGIKYRTNRQLDAIKQAWRDCDNWHPTDCLFEVEREAFQFSTHPELDQLRAMVNYYGNNHLAVA